MLSSGCFFAFLKKKTYCLQYVLVIQTTHVQGSTVCSAVFDSYHPSRTCITFRTMFYHLQLALWRMITNTGIRHNLIKTFPLWHVGAHEKGWCILYGAQRLCMVTDQTRKLEMDRGLNFHLKTFLPESTLSSPGPYLDSQPTTAKYTHTHIYIFQCCVWC